MKQTDKNANNMQAINTVTEEQIGNFLNQLAKNKKEWVETTTQFKKNKENICEYLNVSNSVYISILATYKRNKIEQISKENKADKQLLKSFENVANIVFKDLQTNTKYSEYTRLATKQYKDVNSFMNTFCKNYINGQIVTVETLYNVEKCLIVKRYNIDTKQSYSKVFSLICGALDTFKYIRQNNVREKEWELRKYVVGEVYGVFKFGDINKNTGRPLQGEKILKYTDEDLNSAVPFDKL